MLQRQTPTIRLNGVNTKQTTPSKQIFAEQTDTLQVRFGKTKPETKTPDSEKRTFSFKDRMTGGARGVKSYFAKDKIIKNIGIDIALGTVVGAIGAFGTPLAIVTIPPAIGLIFLASLIVHGGFGMMSPNRFT